MKILKKYLKIRFKLKGGKANGILKKSLNKVNVQENTLYDIIYDLFFYAKLQESEEDIKMVGFAH